ncbi:hypothetical protein Sjap_023787 [Stephania japonica]|uniref:J domain-containing protein n=1 Tax=Stephania japonica TaxID=461633 RepID=A0AAP0EC91_9MAGN
MGVDYYNMLKVSRSATDEDLKRSYKRLAMRWHPDKNPSSGKAECEVKFKQISEAYDVLSDPQKRQIYDAFGEEGLKSGQGQAAGGGGYSASRTGTASRFGGSSRASSFQFNPRRAEDIYEEMFGGSGGGAAQRKAAAMENKLPCSLEELCLGTNKKMKISRDVADSNGNIRTTEEILTFAVKPGWKKGTKITFPEKGNQEAGAVPGDLVFVIDEKPHGLYKRDGNDLVINQRISLLDALTGKNLNLPTLDGRTIYVPVTDIVRPGYEMIVSGEGMPISKEPGKKGDLRIKFDVKFPSRLTSEQKSNLRMALGDAS